MGRKANHTGGINFMLLSPSKNSEYRGLGEFFSLHVAAGKKTCITHSSLGDDRQQMA